jgi:hypothetical protein
LWSEEEVRHPDVRAFVEGLGYLVSHLSEIGADSVLGWISPVEGDRRGGAEKVHQQGGPRPARQRSDSHDREHVPILAYRSHRCIDGAITGCAGWTDMPVKV